MEYFTSKIQNGGCKFKTLCSICKVSIQCDWPEKIAWNKKTLGAMELISFVLRGHDYGVICKKCEKAKINKK